jgi:hypothetical protein
LYSDNLSDVPDDIFSDSECESDRECKRNAFRVTVTVKKPSMRVMIVAIPGMWGQPSGQKKIKR